MIPKLIAATALALAFPACAATPGEVPVGGTPREARLELENMLGTKYWDSPATRQMIAQAFGSKL